MFDVADHLDQLRRRDTTWLVDDGLRLIRRRDRTAGPRDHEARAGPDAA